MAKWGLIILSAILGLSLGGIVQQFVCDTAKQELGTGGPVMKATCAVLSIPIDVIILVGSLIGLAIYLIYHWDD